MFWRRTLSAGTIGCGFLSERESAHRRALPARRPDRSDRAPSGAKAQRAPRQVILHREHYRRERRGRRRPGGAGDARRQYTAGHHQRLRRRLGDQFKSALRSDQEFLADHDRRRIAAGRGQQSFVSGQNDEGIDRSDERCAGQIQLCSRLLSIGFGQLSAERLFKLGPELRQACSRAVQRRSPRSQFDARGRHPGHFPRPAAVLPLICNPTNCAPSRSQAISVRRNFPTFRH